MLLIPRRHHSLHELEGEEAFSPYSLFERLTDTAVRGKDRWYSIASPEPLSCYNSAEHHLLKQSFVYIKSYFKHDNGIILYLYSAIHPRGSQNVSATYGQQLFNSG